MASDKLKGMLNDAIVREMTVAIQYMWQHVTIKGMFAQAVGPVFRVTALQEMLHAEMIGERLDYLGGKLPIAPQNVQVGGTAEQMIKNDIIAEEEAIAMYKEIIKLADAEGEIATKKLFENILMDEENHHNIFTGLLEK